MSAQESKFSNQCIQSLSMLIYIFHIITSPNRLIPPYLKKRPISRRSLQTGEIGVRRRNFPGQMKRQARLPRVIRRIRRTPVWQMKSYPWDSAIFKKKKAANFPRSNEATSRVTKGQPMHSASVGLTNEVLELLPRARNHVVNCNTHQVIVYSLQQRIRAQKETVFTYDFVLCKIWIFN